MSQGQAPGKSSIQTQTEALDAVNRAWPLFVDECRSVLASELHYQALLYHCLRTHGGVPSAHLGMNVKIWIPDVASDLFRALDVRKAEGFRGGFEPIPDVVVFGPDIGGDFRRRNLDNTLRHMLVAIEVKASERHQGRLRPGEIVDDVLKLDALRTEARHRGSDLLPAVVIVDTAPEEGERMTPGGRRAAEDAALEREVYLFYVSPTEQVTVPPAAQSTPRRDRGQTKPQRL